MAHHGASSLIPSDTTSNAMRRYVERLRSTPPRERLERALRLSQQVRNATMADVRRKNPEASEADLAIAFLRRVYGDAIAERFAERRR
jgi:hypothetical protein